MEISGPRGYKFRNKKKNIWMDWPHAKRRGRLTVESSRKQQERKI
jgi:hypothetical protein